MSTLRQDTLPSNLRSFSVSAFCRRCPGRLKRLPKLSEHVRESRFNRIRVHEDSTAIRSNCDPPSSGAGSRRSPAGVDADRLFTMRIERCNIHKVDAINAAAAATAALEPSPPTVDRLPTGSTSRVATKTRFFHYHLHQ